MEGVADVPDWKKQPTIAGCDQKNERHRSTASISCGLGALTIRICHSRRPSRTSQTRSTRATILEGVNKPRERITDPVALKSE